MKKVWITIPLFFLLIFAAWYLVIELGKKYIAPSAKKEKIYAPIRPSTTHPQYWSMNGENVMLLGGSVEDNLFQIRDLETHLDVLKSAGGNYVRNTMSSRDSGNVWAFARNEEGYYDLRSENDEYWKRFREFLDACDKREIVVQIELWATFDFYRGNWEVNPFNPKNNINYTAERVQIPTEVKSHPTWTENNFFRSVPTQEHNLRLLDFQQRFIDKLLSISLNYGNVLYCMDNETSVTSEWGKFWSLYIKKVAKEHGKQIFTTEMWDPWNLNHVAHRETFDHPEIYDFVDISQNNHNSGDTHWANGLKQIERLTLNGNLRPLNNVKVYGNDGGRHQTTQNAIECFVRNVLLGAASTRFHRPASGQGLNTIARQVIASMRSFVDSTDFFHAKPSNHLLAEREENEAFCRAIEGKEYAIYFPNGGKVLLQCATEQGEISIRWLDILKSGWTKTHHITVRNSKAEISAPDHKNWLALIKWNP
ncbi:MAG: hypothetical protein MI975_26590 [Cytophagales bacterium]|nr:hypothetical protein [Cytophagales bacterium]